MTRTKKIRFTAAKDEPLLIQSGKDFFEKAKGNRRADFFHNNNPIVLELACGRGEYSVGLAKVFPDKNFIGVDIKAERMMQGVKDYKDDSENNKKQNNNIAFLRTIIQNLDRFFDHNEVDEIRIVHPDPRPKWHDERRRMTSPRFLKIYEKILKTWGILRLKTDDDAMFNYSCEKLEQSHFKILVDTHDLSSSILLSDHHNIQTYYENFFVSQWRTIKYGKWKLLKNE